MHVHTPVFKKKRKKKEEEEEKETGHEKAAITTVASLRLQMERGGWLSMPRNVVTSESAERAQTFQADFCKCRQSFLLQSADDHISEQQH